MRKLMLGLLVVSIAAHCANQTEAAFIPFGVHNDVSYNTVINDWGWTVAYRGAYEQDGVSIDSMFQAATSDYVMLASIKDGVASFDILAATLRTEVQTYTAYNAPHQSNGASWYYNGLSMGFAGIGDAIRQGSADTIGSHWFTPDLPEENDRLSWHTGTTINGNKSDLVAPTYVMSGWRSGTTSDKNVYDGTWDRLILTANADVNTTAVPEPATMTIWGLGALGCAAAAYRRRKRAA